MYCENCQALTPENEVCCLRCGEKTARQPRPEDYCFLVEKEMLWGEMLADVLEQENIPFEISVLWGLAWLRRLACCRNDTPFMFPIGIMSVRRKLWRSCLQ